VLEHPDRRKHRAGEYRMLNVANASINTFGTSPKADFVPPDDPILEIPLSELQALYNSSVALFNDILDIAREERLLDKKDSAELLKQQSRMRKALSRSLFCSMSTSKKLSSLSERP
jgi:hypothetical protein